MIIECPNCGTKYAVREEAIKPRGRTVRCTTCGKEWHADGAPPVIIEQAPPEESELGSFTAPPDRDEEEATPFHREDEADAEEQAEDADFASAAEDEAPLISAAPELRASADERSRRALLPTFALLPHRSS